MISNPLFDLQFLRQLFEQKERTIFARITALTKDELPIEYIEGKVTGGSINVDGNSAVRRTCNLTMVAQDININDFYWGLKNKFKLEIGLQNNINIQYPEIIWFKQGLYVITSFNTTQSTNNYNISISGKDKMCLLNGDLAGALPHTTDFGIQENYDSTTGITSYESIPIKRIIREAVQNFGNELAQNIIINDIEDAGLELLEYRGNIPMYLLREVNSDIFTNMTLNNTQDCYVNGEKIPIGNLSNYDNLIDLEGEQDTTVIKLNPDSKYEYTVAKIEYGSIPGYRLTDLVFAGDLIANVGETLTSVLDKIKNMLGEFEYFYNLDGKFVFQKKRNYVDIPWHSAENNDEIYTDAAINNSSPVWSFVDSQLISSFQNTPNLSNLRNDFAVWGTRKTPGGVELDIHMRYAIDKKPTYYKTVRYSEDNENELLENSYVYDVKDGWDWRELIYQMALDYRKNYHKDNFLYDLAKNNSDYYATGKTGYEQYYTDLEGFWRLLYNPDPEIKYESIEYNKIIEKDNLYIQNYYYPVQKDEITEKNYNDIYVFHEGILCPYNNGGCLLQPNTEYYFKVVGNEILSSLDSEILKLKNIEEIFINAKGDRYIDDYFTKETRQLYLKSNDKILFNKISDNNLKSLYINNNSFKQNINHYDINNYGGYDSSKPKAERINYLNSYYDFHHDENNKNYWSKQINDNPENLLFWFDFLDAEGSGIAKYSVPAVGSRTKAINDKDVKSIYYREIPTTIFQTGEQIYEHQTGYTYIQLQNTMENLFTISSKGKSAKERIEELLYTHSYCIENTSITTVPVYNLEPDNKIFIRDENSKVNGEYIINKLTIPLTYNGTMNITATKAVSNIN